VLQSPEGDFAHCNWALYDEASRLFEEALQSPEGDFAHCNLPPCSVNRERRCSVVAIPRRGFCALQLVIVPSLREPSDLLGLQSPEGDFAHSNDEVMHMLISMKHDQVAIPRRGFCAFQRDENGFIVGARALALQSPEGDFAHCNCSYPSKAARSS